MRAEDVAGRFASAREMSDAIALSVGGEIGPEMEGLVVFVFVRDLLVAVGSGGSTAAETDRSHPHDACTSSRLPR